LPAGADVILEMSGSEKALNDGLKVVRAGGRVTLLGLPGDKVSIDLSNDVILKGLTLQGIFGRKIFATWELSSRLLKHGSIDLEKIITHRLKIQDYENAFKLMSEGKCGKIVMTF
ncbi:MAG: zinc-binding dehydrogenase, partial [Nitrososphaerales archaeon]